MRTIRLKCLLILVYFTFAMNAFSQFSNEIQSDKRSIRKCMYYCYEKVLSFNDSIELVLIDDNLSYAEAYLINEYINDSYPSLNLDNTPRHYFFYDKKFLKRIWSKLRKRGNVNLIGGIPERNFRLAFYALLTTCRSDKNLTDNGSFYKNEILDLLDELYETNESECFQKMMFLCESFIDNSELRKELFEEGVNVDFLIKSIYLGLKKENSEQNKEVLESLKIGDQHVIFLSCNR